jgi:ubiquinol-cytochrome c reductase cytochrome c subunit
MRALSTRRRHPLAGLVVLLMGLLVAGGLYSALAPRAATADTADAAAVEEGRELFLIGCASCHGKNGEGILAADGSSNYGPSLVGVGAASVDFQVGTGRMPMAQAAPQAPDKPPIYTEEETAQLAAFVASLGPGPAIPSEEDYSPDDVDDEGTANGGEIFRANCTACHNSVGAGGALPDGRYAPTLSGVDDVHIYEAMLTGPQQMPVFPDETITPEEKREVIAYINSVQDQPEYGGFGLGGLGPVAEGAVVWGVGMGVLVAFAVWIATQGARARRQE